MKNFLTGLLPVALCLLAARPAALAQSTAFTYHGQLTYKGAPANGTFDLQFVLFDAEVAGQLVRGPVPVNGLTVANGLLTVRLDFGENVFSGPPRWLEIAVRPVGGANFSPLLPRQEVTSSPYAIRAQTAAMASELSAGAAVKTVNGLKDNVTLAAGPNVTITPSGNTLTIGSAGSGGSGIWSVDANNAYYLAGSVAIGTNAPAAGVRLQVNGNTQITTGGSGGYVQIGTPNGETGLSVLGKNRFDLRFDGNTLKLAANAGLGPPSPHNGITINTNGNVGVGMESPLLDSQWKLEVNGPVRLNGGGRGGAINFSAPNGESGISFVGANRADIRYDGSVLKLVAGTVGPPDPSNGITIDTLGNVGMGRNLSFGAQGRQMINLWSTSYGIGIQNATLYNRCGSGSGDGFAWYKGGIHDERYHNGGGGELLMWLDSGGLSVSTLTIRGGADLAEPFELSKKDIPKGSVVIIDSDNEGKLKLSDHSYDQRVAGVVSGANGVNPGISLRQEGVLEGGQNVALSGRVYVLADAETGTIKPGDLLTSSETPGHAMKVRDHGRAQGAILGKAMSSLKEGKGLVLVLVTLQ